MKYRRFSIIIVFTLLAIITAGLLSGCSGGSTPVTTPPAPVLTSSVTVTATTPVASATSTSTTTSTAVTTPSAEKINVISDDAVIDFPDDITFSMAAKSGAVIKKVTLLYGSDERALAPRKSSSEAVFTEGKDVNASWSWQMKKTGSIPPGASLWWQWRITDEAGTVYSTEKQTLVYADTRFTWSMKESDAFNIYWHTQDDSLINELLADLNSKLARIELNVSIPDERKPKVFVYTSSEELRDAVLFEQEWTGALAYTTYNIILTAVNEDTLAWAKDALPHEITHLLVEEATFGPFGDIPTWLNEGLAQYSETAMSAYDEEILDKAVSTGTLLSLNTLSGSFPTASEGAYLAYAESNSVVSYLIGQYGWEKMRALLETFRDGSTDDKALLKVYSFDVAGLEAAWKTFIGAK